MINTSDIDTHTSNTQWYIRAHWYLVIYSKMYRIIPTLLDSLILPTCLKIVKIFLATWSNLKDPPAPLFAFKSASVMNNLFAVSMDSAARHSETRCLCSTDNLAGFVRKRMEYFSSTIRLRTSMNELTLVTGNLPRKYFGSDSNSPGDKWGNPEDFWGLGDATNPTRFFGALSSFKNGLKFSLNSFNWFFSFSRTLR